MGESMCGIQNLFLAAWSLSISRSWIHAAIKKIFLINILVVYGAIIFWDDILILGRKIDLYGTPGLKVGCDPIMPFCVAC